MRERSNGGEGTTGMRLARGEREEEQGTTRRGEGGEGGGAGGHHVTVLMRMGGENSYFIGERN